MKKRMLSTLLALCMVLSLLPLGTAWADTSDSYDAGWWSYSDGTLTIQGTSTGNYGGSGMQPWSDYHSQIRNIIIIDSVTSIGSYAFAGCSNATSVTIPDSVTSIGGYAFTSCSSLTSVSIPNSVTNIGRWAFRCCSSLASVTIPNSVSSMGDEAFFDCSNLTSVTISNSITDIESSVFSGCNSLISVTIPKSITSIGWNAFGSCNSLTDVYYSGSESDWEAISGDGKSNLTKDTITIHYNSTGPDDPDYPSGACGNNLTWKLTNGTLKISGTGDMWDFDVINIVDTTAPWYDYRSEISAVEIENGVTSIGDHAFYYCTSLSDIDIPASVTSIGELAFYACYSLSDISIPESVTSIGPRVFYRSALKDIYYAGNEEQWNTIAIDSNNSELRSATIHYNGTGPDDPGKDPSTGDIRFEELTCSVTQGQEIALRAYVTTDAEKLPKDYITWTSSNTEIVSIKAGNILLTTGYVTFLGVSPGTATITATTADGKSASCTVTVTPKPNKIQLTGERAVLVGENEPHTAKVTLNTVDPDDCVEWSSSNSDIVAFDSNGTAKVSRPISEMTIVDSTIEDTVQIYGRTNGTATVTCKMTKTGAEQEFDVLVYKDKTKDFRKLAKDFEKNFNKYKAELKKHLEKNRSVVTDAMIEEQARKLMEQDEKSSSKLVTFNDRCDETIRVNVYKAVAQFLADSIAHQVDLGEIDASADELDNIPPNLVLQVYNMIDTTPYQYKYGDVKVIIGGGISFDGAHMRQITYKQGLKSIDAAELISSPSAVEAVIRTYLQQLLRLEKNLMKTAFAEATKELFGATLGELMRPTVKDAVTDALTPYISALEQSGAGKVVTAVSTAADYYSYIKNILEFMQTDPRSAGNLPKLSFEPTSIKDKAIGAAMVPLDSLGSVLGQAIDEFFTTGDVNIDEIENKWVQNTKQGIISTLMCPVNVTIYDSTGARVGYVGDDDTWYDENVIHIEHFGDVKTIYSTDKSLKFDIIATDYGELNCTFEEYADGMPVSRVNYYDIPLYEGKLITATIPNESLTTENVVVSTGDSGIIPADEDITGAEYETAKATITCTADAAVGGQISGVGEYVRRDAVTLIATPENGYVFMGWKNNEGALVSIDSVYEFTAKEDIELTALFVKQSGSENPPSINIITFDAVGGTVTPMTATTDIGGKLVTLPIPTRDGYTFDGWYTAVDGGEQVEESRVYTENTTLYAHWTENAAPSHIHNWSTVWSSDATHHWHECSVSDCPITSNSDKDGYSEHIYANDADTTCNICGYPRTVTPPRPVDRNETYYISISKTDNGEIIPSTRYAEEGERVALTVHPNAGYELDSLTVTNVRGREITLRDLGNNRYSFTMPNTRVSVEASFTKIVDDTFSTPTEDEPFTGLGTPGISGIVLNPAVMPFTDVKSTDWFYDNVDYVWKHYLMSGVSDTQFAPDITTSRAMIWTILARMNNVRTDINPGSTWYERGLLWAQEQGVTDGTNPMADITREQLATMLWRNAGRPAPGAAADLSRFSDSGTVSEYAQTAVRWAASVGILNGSDGKIDPQGTATRAQVAAMVARYGDRVA